MSKKAGLIAATILMPYLTVGVGGMWWLEWEFWGSLFSIFALSLYLQEHRNLAVIPAVFAVACKETLMGALLGGLMSSLVRRDKGEILVWIGGFGAYVSYEIWHLWNVISYLHATFGIQRVSHGGLTFVAATFQFGAPWLGVGLIGILIGLSILGIMSMRPLSLFTYAFMTTLVPIIVFLFLGYEYDTYWGVVYVPFVLLTVAYMVGMLHKTNDAKAHESQPSEQKTSG